ncbi:MAG TPA: hypothetical protein VEC16_01905 [Alphaproteobacteria bacterium]|nr:hypothetical protein [Alphaproteobacteria bacterium]
MFLGRKNGDITLQQLVLIVVAVIMIIIVTSFGSKVWASFFPSADKSTEDSFNTFASVINAKSATPLSYDMTPLTLYLSEGYCMIYFYGGPSTDFISVDGTSPSSAGTGGASYTTVENKYYRPSICNGEPCICLYDGRPEKDQENRNENVVSCKPIAKPVNINYAYYDFRGIICGTHVDTTRYRPLLIIRYTESSASTNKNFIYILNDTNTNRELHKKWSVPICTSDKQNLCYGKRDDEIVRFTTGSELDRVRQYCGNVADKNYLSTGVKCLYDPKDRSCNVDCSAGDIKSECGTTYKTCSDFNKIAGVEKYLSTDESNVNYQYYHMCLNNQNYCNLNPACGVTSWDAYIKLDSLDGSVKNTDDIFTEDIKTKCSIKFLTILDSKYDYYLLSYNTNEQNCVEYFKEKFSQGKNTFMACKQGNNANCKTFITQNTEKCGLKFVYKGDHHWITYHNDEEGCSKEIEKNFEIAYKCVSG